MYKILEQDVQAVIKSIGEGINRFKGKKILITGATGFIGINLLNSLVFLNDTCPGCAVKIFALGRNLKKLDHIATHLLDRQDLIWLSGDVRTFEFLDESFDFVIHAAAPVPPNISGQNQLEAAQIIVDGTRQILQQSCLRKVTRFLYISSGAVYGAQPPDLPRISEDYQGGLDIANPTSAYGEAKRKAEMLCRDFQQNQGLPVVIARPFTFTGPFLDPGFAVTQFIEQGLKGQPIQIKGDGTPLRSYCYAADLTAALLKILLDAEDGRVYNVGSEEEVSIFELARKIVSIIGLKQEIQVSQKAVAGQKPSRYIPDISRLKSELHFVPQYGLDEALSRTVAWAREKGRR